jgi:hypothetical protein
VLGNILIASAIVYFGIRVFAGDFTATKLFAILVALSYLGLTVTNLWHFNDYPSETRAAQMAVPRMIRGLLFAAVYIWYYLMRPRTAQGFNCTAKAKVDSEEQPTSLLENSGL